jgi:hypothetical protein
MPNEPSYIQPNTRERERMRDIIRRATDDDLRHPVNRHWTVAGVLGHIAFWDGRQLALTDKLERGIPFTESDNEPEDVDWINDASRPLIHAIDPRKAAELALQIAGEIDARVASIPPSKMWPEDRQSLINPLRAAHRGEHLDEIEAALHHSPL